MAVVQLPELAPEVNLPGAACEGVPGLGGQQRGPAGVVFTTLIPGRIRQVSVAPVEARVPEEWRPLADLF